MEKTIKIDSIDIQDIIDRINYSEEIILDAIEGLAETACVLCVQNESPDMINAIGVSQKILCELIRLNKEN